MDEQISAIKTDIAIIKERDLFMATQQERINQELVDIKRVLKEIHDKLDRNILDLNLSINNEKHNRIRDIDRLDHKVGLIYKVSGLIGAMIATVVSGAISFFKN
jgi:hypothetical protein